MASKAQGSVSQPVIFFIKGVDNQLRLDYYKDVSKPSKRERKMASHHKAINTNYPVPAPVKRRFARSADEVSYRYLGDATYVVSRNPGDLNDTWFVNREQNYGEIVEAAGGGKVWEIDTIDYEGHGKRSSYLVDESGSILGSAQW